MKKLLLLSFFVAIATMGSAQTNKVPVTATDTTINPGKTVIVDGDEVLNPDVNDNLDNLLSIWYLQKALRDTSDMGIDLEDDYMTANLPDSVYINRIKKMPTLIDLPYNHMVRNSIIFYTQRIPEKTEMILGLSQYYLPMIEEILDSYNLPLELRAMAIIESALDPRAVSRAKAKGMWQFMYRTALEYKLKINSYVDERLDPIAATHAAAKYMSDLHGIFGDWSLAIAAYNCGTGNVQKAIRRSGGKRDYWDIYPYLPKETRGYVPNFIAASYLLEYYKEHHLQPKSISMPAQVDTFLVNKMLHFEQISEVLGISIDELRDFNPQYMHDIIPGTSCTYSLCIPYEYTGAFAEKENDIYSYKDSVYFNPNIIRQIAQKGTNSITSVAGRKKTIHRVKKGETVSLIAQKYSVTISDIQYWNNIKTKISVGQKIVVHAKGNAAQVAATTTTPKSTSSDIHVVKKGDTLWNIAQAYDDISFYDLLQLNNLKKNSTIRPGDKLKIKKM